MRQSRLVAAGGIAVAVYALAFYGAMHIGGVAVGTVLSLASAPLASGVLERVVDQRTLGRRWWIAALLGVAGCTLLCLSTSKGAEPSATATIASVALGVVAGTAYAFYSWVIHRMLRNGVGRNATMGAIFGLGGSILMPVLVVTGAPLLESPRSLTAVAYLVVVPMFLGYILFGIGLTRIRPSIATTLTLTEPAVAAILAIVVVGERLPVAGWGGLFLIAAALAVIVAGPARGGRSRTPRDVDQYTTARPGVDPEPVPAHPSEIGFQRAPGAPAA